MPPTLPADLDDDLEQFRQVANEFARDRLTPPASTIDRFPFDSSTKQTITALQEEMVALGLTAITLPEDLGGTGLPRSVLGEVLREFSQVDASQAAFTLTNALAQDLLVEGATDDLLAEVFDVRTTPPLLATTAYTDPTRSGSLPHLTAGADTFVLTGAIDDVVLGGFASWAVVPAHHEESGAVSYCLVDLRDPGVSVSEPVVSLGFHACPSVDVIFSGVPARLVGQPGGGAGLFRTVSAPHAVSTAAISAGLMRGSLDTATAYTRERKQGGRLLIGWSEVRALLAEMEMRTRTADLCLDALHRRVRAQRPGWEQDARAASVMVHEMAAVVVDHGVQLLGGNGYTKDYTQEKRYRDARQAQTLLGAPAVKKNDLVPAPAS